MAPSQLVPKSIRTHIGQFVLIILVNSYSFGQFVLIWSIRTPKVYILFIKGMLIHKEDMLDKLEKYKWVTCAICLTPLKAI